MRFPNAYAGVKKIRTAEILGLISGIILFVAMVLMLVGAIAAAANPLGGLGALAGGGVLTVAASVLAIIAFILNLVGLSKAKADEPQFKNALIAILVSLIASVIASLFSSNETLKDIFTLLQNVALLVSTILVIQGIMSLADQLKDSAVKQRGNSILKLITCVYVLILIADVIAVFLPSISVAAGVIALIAVLLSVIQYFIYLGYLKKAVVMLAEGQTVEPTKVEEAAKEIRQDLTETVGAVKEVAADAAADVKETAEKVAEGVKEKAEDIKEAVDKIKDDAPPAE